MVRMEMEMGMEMAMLTCFSGFIEVSSSKIESAELLCNLFNQLADSWNDDAVQEKDKV